jgi:hypothetical protein
MVRERTILTERQPLVGEVTAKQIKIKMSVTWYWSVNQNKLRATCCCPSSPYSIHMWYNVRYTNQKMWIFVPDTRFFPSYHSCLHTSQESDSTAVDIKLNAQNWRLSVFISLRDNNNHTAHINKKIRILKCKSEWKTSQYIYARAGFFSSTTYSAFYHNICSNNHWQHYYQHIKA